jgi:hypothetical protein
MDRRRIDTGSIVTAAWVRLKCQFGCSGFGMSLCCPPYTPTPDVTRKVIDSYEKAILLHQRLKKMEKRRISMRSSVILKSRSFWMAIIRFSAWAPVVVSSVKNATQVVLVSMGVWQDLRWRHVGLMSIRPQGTMDFQLTWYGLMRMKEITSDWCW